MKPKPLSLTRRLIVPFMLAICSVSWVEYVPIARTCGDPRRLPSTRCCDCVVDSSADGGNHAAPLKGASQPVGTFGRHHECVTVRPRRGIFLGRQPEPPDPLPARQHWPDPLTHRTLR